MANSPLRAAIFDFGGVMTEPLFTDYSHVPEDLMGLVTFFLGEFRDVYHLPTGAHDLHLLETGKIGDAEFFVRICTRYEEAGNPHVDPAAAQHAVWGREMVACGEMVDAVRQLRAGGVMTALLTNISRDGEWLWRTTVPADELFDSVIDSSKVGLRKPDPEIYLLACSRLGVEPAECLFVDDIASNVAAADALGMTTIRCIDPADCADDIVRLFLGHDASDETSETAAS